MKCIRLVALAAAVLGLSGCVTSGEVLNRLGVELPDIRIPGFNPSYSRTPGAGLHFDEARWTVVRDFDDGHGTSGAIVKHKSKIGIAVEGADVTLVLPEVKGRSLYYPRDLLGSQFAALKPGHGAVVLRTSVRREVRGRRTKCDHDYFVVAINPQSFRSWGVGGCDVPFSFAPSADGNGLIMTAMETGGDLHFRLDTASLEVSDGMTALSPADHAAVYGSAPVHASSATHASESPQALPRRKPSPPSAGKRLEPVTVAPNRVDDPGTEPNKAILKLD